MRLEKAYKGQELADKTARAGFAHKEKLANLDLTKRKAELANSLKELKANLRTKEK